MVDHLQHKNVLTCCSFDLSPLYPTTCSLFMKTQLSVCLMLGARAKKKWASNFLVLGLLRKASPCQPKCGASPCSLLTVLSVCSFISFVLMMVLTLNV